MDFRCGHYQPAYNLLNPGLDFFPVNLLLMTVMNLIAWSVATQQSVCKKTFALLLAMTMKNRAVKFRVFMEF